METLRRATLYARKDPVAAINSSRGFMLARLPGIFRHPDALAWFDAGYLAKPTNSGSPKWMRVSKDEQNPAAGVDGYALVKKALGLRGRTHRWNSPA